MKNRKNVLKDAGVFLVAAILVLTAIGIFPTVKAQWDHDVGVIEIISPPTNGALQTYPVEVKVHNFGENPETTDVQVEIIKSGGAEYAELVEDVYVPYPGDVVVKFPDWTPSSTGTFDVCGFTILDGDQEPGNDETCIVVTIDVCDIEIERVWGGKYASPSTINEVKAIIKNNGGATQVNWVISFSSSPFPPDSTGTVPLSPGNPITVCSNLIPWWIFSGLIFPKTVTVTATAQCGDQHSVTKKLFKPIPAIRLWFLYT